MSAGNLLPTSRYFSVATTTLTRADGTVIVYLRRRFVPQPDAFVALNQHTVLGGDRPDTLAAKYLGDPELFWRICDANSVIAPNDLTATPGEQVTITLPQGIPGVGNA